MDIVGDKNIYQNKERFVAIIGSRKANERELEIAYNLSRKLVQKGYIIVSGLALGVDTYAHKGAIDGKGKTIAIVSTSPGEPIYPKENQNLANIIKKHGCIIYPYNEPARWEKGFNQFQKRLVERDVLLAHLCPRIIVVKNEDIIIGGTAWGVNYGIKFNKDVWRVDNNYKFYKNPEHEKKEVWWDMELELNMLLEQ